MSQNKPFRTYSRKHSVADWNPAPGAGSDKIKFNVPDGEKFTHYDIDLYTSRRNSGYQVVSPPHKGATGRQSITINWYCRPFGGNVSYAVKLFSGEQKTAKVIVDDIGWQRRSVDRINQRSPMQLVLQGPQAKQVYQTLVMQPSSEMYQPADLFPVPDYVALPEFDTGNGHHAQTTDGPAQEVFTTTLVISIAVVAAIAIIVPAVAWVLTAAINENYTIDLGEFDIDSPIGQFKTIFVLTPPK